MCHGHGGWSVGGPLEVAVGGWRWFCWGFWEAMNVGVGSLGAGTVLLNVFGLFLSSSLMYSLGVQPPQPDPC